MNTRKLTKTVDNLMAAIEAVLVAVFGRLVCWAAPLPSAYLVGQAARDIFSLPEAWRWVFAGIIEFVGLVTTNHWTTVKEWNATKNKNEPAGNERLAKTLVVGYFVATVALLLAIEIPQVIHTGNVTQLTALLFPGLSAVALVTMNERIAQAKRQSDKEAVKAERKAKRQKNRQARRQASVANVSSQTSKTAVSDTSLDVARQTRKELRQARLDSLATFLDANPDSGATEAARAIGVSRQTAYTYAAELGHKFGGNGATQ